MKLSLEALKERSEAVASTELLATISGGLENACHDGDCSAVVGIAKFFIWLQSFY